MLHGVRLQAGRASWYRNRWVRTGALAGRRFLTWRGADLTAVPMVRARAERMDIRLCLMNQFGASTRR